MIRKNPYYTETNSNGTKCWYLNDKLHRVDGPAVEYSDGDKAWYLNGIEYTECEYNKETTIQGR